MIENALTRDDLTRTIGDVDDVVAAELLSVGANLTELLAALRVLEQDEHLLTDEPVLETPMTSPRMNDLLEILRRIDDQDEEAEYLGTD
ncbi:MAG TPA: hypothetical protein VM734_03920 [Kofleriaceae bacterium]|nr:hypothetical protein [Kofleriaceae bacterium]